MRTTGPASTLCTIAMTWLARFSMETSCHSSGSLPPNPGRLGLMTRQPSCSASRALSRQYMPPPAKKPWMLTAQIGGDAGAVGTVRVDVVRHGEAQPVTVHHDGAGDHPDGRALADLAGVLIAHDAEAVRGVAGVDQGDRGGAVRGSDDGAGDLQLIVGRRAAAFDLNHRTAITTLQSRAGSGASFTPTRRQNRACSPPYLTYPAV